MNPREEDPLSLKRLLVPAHVGLRWKSWGARRASDSVLDIAKALTSRHGASARLSRAGR